MELQSEHFVVLDSTSEIKTSIHVVLCGYHLRSVKALHNLMSTHLKPLVDEMATCIDIRFYSKNSNFRLMECCKFKNFEKPFLRLSTDHGFDDALITKIPEYSQLLHIPEQE